MNNQITIAVAVIRNDRGELLLARRHQPDIPEIHNRWEFVGGGIEYGEDPIDAIRREVKEEIGVEVGDIKLFSKVLSEVQKFSDGEKHFFILTYECKIISGEPKPTDPEIAEVKYVTLEEAKNYKAFNNIYKTIELLS